jgi:hypothetical protein
MSFKFCIKSTFSPSLELTFMSKYLLKNSLKFTSNTSVQSLSIAVSLDFNQFLLCEQKIRLEHLHNKVTNETYNCLPPKRSNNYNNYLVNSVLPYRNCDTVKT